MAKKRKIRTDRMLILIGIAAALVLGLILVLKGCGQKKEETKPEETKTAETDQTQKEETPEESKKPEKPEEPEEPKEPEIDPETDPRFFDTDSLLVIANKKHRLPEGYVPSDLAYPEGVEMRYNTWSMRLEAAVAIEEMFAAAENEGVHLVMGSGYRGEDFQTTLYYGYVDSYGKETADAISSRPGYSDHQTGLATDLCGVDTAYDLTQEFEGTDEGKWLAAHAHEYGFIMRYPKDKEDITGYSYEPWHFRYVGKEEAAKIYAAGADMTMEEYYHISGGDYAD